MGRTKGIVEIFRSRTLKRSFAVIGLGRFGFHLARILGTKGHDVVAIDRSQEKVGQIKDMVSKAVVADVTDRETMQTLGMEAVDAAVISLGNRIDASVLCTMYLKELGVRKIIVEAVSEDHEKILKLVGSTDVVFPDRDMADRIADKLSTPHLIDSITFSDGYSVAELKTPAPLKNKTIGEAGVRGRYGVVIIAVRRGENPPIVSPAPTLAMKEEDVLTVIGRDDDLDSFKKL